MGIFQFVISDERIKNGKHNTITKCRPINRDYGGWKINFMKKIVAIFLLFLFWTTISSAQPASTGFESVSDGSTTCYGYQLIPTGGTVTDNNNGTCNFTVSGGIDGSGTANYVTKWSDSNTLTNSIIFDNGSRLGIGTATPDTALYIDIQRVGTETSGWPGVLNIGHTIESVSASSLLWGSLSINTETDVTNSNYTDTIEPFRSRFVHNMNGTISNVILNGTKFENSGSSGTVTNIYNYFADADDLNTGTTTTNRYGLYISNPIGSGTLTNNYGIYIADQTKGTTDYSIYNAGGSVGGLWDFAAAILELPNTTACVSTDCDAAGEAGRICIDTDATSGQRLYVCEGVSGWILQGDGNTGGATAWDDIADPDAAATIAFAGFEQDITSTLDGGNILEITNTDADAASDTTFLRLVHNDGLDVNVIYFSGIGDSDGTPTNDYIFSQTSMSIIPPLSATGGATISSYLNIPNGTAPTIDAAGEIAQDTSDDQLVYGATPRVIPYERTICAVIESLAATDDNFAFYMANDAITVTSVGCNCRGTCSTLSTFTLEDRGGNAMTITGTNPTCATGGAATFAAVTATNQLTAGEMIAFDVTNTPTADDTYALCVTYTVDRQ